MSSTRRSRRKALILGVFMADLLFLLTCLILRNMSYGFSVKNGGGKVCFYAYSVVQNVPSSKMLSWCTPTKLRATEWWWYALTFKATTLKSTALFYFASIEKNLYACGHCKQYLAWLKLLNSRDFQLGF